MWILHQNKKEIVKIDNVFVLENQIGTKLNNQTFILGQYENEDTALKELSKIHISIDNGHKSYMN